MMEDGTAGATDINFHLQLVSEFQGVLINRIWHTRSIFSDKALATPPNKEIFLNREAVNKQNNRVKMYFY